MIGYKLVISDVWTKSKISIHEENNEATVRRNKQDVPQASLISIKLQYSTANKICQ